MEPNTTTITKKPKKVRARRARGEGSIFQRDDGQWVASVSLTGDDGKRIRRTVYGSTEAEARAKLEQVKNEVKVGVKVASKNTVSELMQAWLSAIEDDVKIKTLKSYEEIAGRYIVPFLGTESLAKLSADDVEGLLRALKKKGLGARTRQLAHAVLRMAFKYAVAKKLIAFSPIDAVPSPRVERKEYQVWTAEQIQQFLVANQGERLFPLFLLMFDTGMRGGEFLGFQRSGLMRLALNEIRIDKNLIEHGGKILELASPKTKAGHRTITITPQTADFLRAHLDRMDAEGLASCDFVFPTSNGTPYTKSNFRKIWVRCVEKAGLPYLPPHGIRHTAASVLISAGVDPRTVGGRLGHARPSVTLDVYSHFMKAADAGAAAHMQAVLPSISLPAPAPSSDEPK